MKIQQYFWQIFGSWNIYFILEVDVNPDKKIRFDVNESGVVSEILL